VWQSFNALRDIGASNKHGYAADAGVGRFKPMIVVSEQNINGTDLAQKKADWLMNRNIGRSQAINIESVGPNAWRDSAGNLFQPNMIAPVHVPILEVIKQTWLISEVTYDFGVETGTKLSATLMPASAFAVEPDIQNNPLAQFSGGQS
jgi:prophage tail gpP-like protein